MSEVEFADFPCDLCGADDAVEISVLRRYHADQPVHVCKQCGFVYVRRRRSAERIAEVWSDDLYGGEYTARIPAVQARLFYVADTLDVELGLAAKSLCDIGAGEGEFLRMVTAGNYAAKPFGVEPSGPNCALMREAGLECFGGTVEDYQAAHGASRKFDLVTILWTLENCQSCLGMLRTAHDVLKDGGHICVATGSRLLVPFKKPLDLYMGPNPSDTHAFRFSANSLRGALEASGFEVTFTNRYMDSDILCVIARKSASRADGVRRRDDWKQVVDFFARWDRETREYFSPQQREPGSC